MKLLKSDKSDPISIGYDVPDAGVSWFRITDKMAWVPHAFWMVCAAKKRPCSEEAVWSYVPSAGEVLLWLGPPIHLKRKMTPYTGLFRSDRTLSISREAGRRTSVNVSCPHRER